MDFKIRLATVKDIDKLTELHCASFHPKDHVPVILGKDYIRATYRWQVTSQATYILIAETDNKVIGLIAVCDGPFTLPMFKACLGQFIVSLVRNPFLLLNGNLWARLFRDSDTSATKNKLAHYPGVAQVTIGAVHAEFRGQSIFPILIEGTKGISKSRGSRAIRVGVYKTNQSVRKAFIKAGWIEAPVFETDSTMFYITYLDPELSKELSLELKNQQYY